MGERDIMGCLGGVRWGEQRRGEVLYNFFSEIKSPSWREAP